jgi:hypothetical protein
MDAISEFDRDGHERHPYRPRRRRWLPLVLAFIAVLAIALIARAQETAETPGPWPDAETLMAILGGLATVAGALFTALTRSTWWAAQDWKTRKVLQIARWVVGRVYESYVREMKEQNPDGKLTPAQRDQAVAMAKKDIRDAAGKFGVAKSPLVTNDDLLTGLVQDTVREVKTQFATKSPQRVGLGRSAVTSRGK